MSKPDDKLSLLSREHANEILRWVVDSSPADQTEAVLVDTRSYLTRFTKNAVHQNVGTRDTHLAIRVMQGRRVGSFSTNLLTADGGGRALKRALEIARLQKPIGFDIELPSATHSRPIETWAEATANCTPATPCVGSTRRMLRNTRSYQRAWSYRRVRATSGRLFALPTATSLA